QEKCHQCHRPGGIAPMSLLTYDQSRPWAQSIRTEVGAKRMPPFHADGPLGYYKDDIRLSAAQIQVVLDWVDSGARKGSPADLPPEKLTEEAGAEPGVPDLIIPFPAI